MEIGSSKFTTMVYEINKSRDHKKRIGSHIWKKISFWIYDYDRKENTLIYAHHISYKFLGNFAHSLNPTFIQNWMKN